MLFKIKYKNSTIYWGAIFFLSYQFIKTVSIQKPYAYLEAWMRRSRCHLYILHRLPIFRLSVDERDFNRMINVFTKENISQIFCHLKKIDRIRNISLNWIKSCKLFEFCLFILNCVLYKVIKLAVFSRNIYLFNIYSFFLCNF